MPCNLLIYKAFCFLLLPDKGSNLDIQIQNLTYYHYTIGQWDGKGMKFRGNLTSREGKIR